MKEFLIFICGIWFSSAIGNVMAGNWGLFTVDAVVIGILFSAVAARAAKERPR